MYIVFQDPKCITVMLQNTANLEITFCPTHYKSPVFKAYKFQHSSEFYWFSKSPHSKHGNAIYSPLILPRGTTCPFDQEHLPALQGPWNRKPFTSDCQHWGETPKSLPYTLQVVEGKNTGFQEYFRYLCSGKCISSQLTRPRTHHLFTMDLYTKKSCLLILPFSFFRSLVSLHKVQKWCFELSH